MVPIRRIGIDGEFRRAVFFVDQPRARKRVRTLDGGHGSDRRVILSEGERSGAPRARCVDDSPMAVPGTLARAAEARSLRPERSARYAKPPHLCEYETVGLGEVKADAMVVNDLGDRFGWTVEPRSRRMRRFAALHLEAELEVMRR